MKTASPDLAIRFMEWGHTSDVADLWECDDQDVTVFLTNHRVRAYVALDADREVIGAIGLDYNGEVTCEIDNLGVAPESRRRGVATALLSAAANIARANRIPGLTALVHEGDLPALAFFSAAGFASQVARDAFGENEDGVRFVKEL